jgi:hypothetical protein
VKKAYPFFCRLLLFVYPRRFRTTYGREALHQLQSDLRDARSAGLVRSSVGRITSLVDFVFAGVSERLASLETKPTRMQGRGNTMSTIVQVTESMHVSWVNDSWLVNTAKMHRWNGTARCVGA